MARLLFLFCFIAWCKGNEPNSLKLEQVLIFSRHNMRAPLISNVQLYTPKTFPKFKEPGAYLTQKGALLESYMAEYIMDWLASENFLKGCPQEKEVLIYANTKPRTLDTAKSFAAAAFPSCNITVHHAKNIEVFDPIFYPIFHNTSEHFVKEMIKEMEELLNETEITDLYLELNRILDLENSEMCKKHSLCDLSTARNTIFNKEGEEPGVRGPLFVGNSALDVFIMSYYEGLPMEDIAWGEIKTDEQWKFLTNILHHDFRVRFKSKPVSTDLARPLLNYMFDIFKSGTPKFTVLFGHDSNLATIIRALGFKEFELEGQYEPMPIGSKLIFEKWSKGEEKYLKVEFVYETFSQLRNGTKWTLENPPKRKLMELEDCKINANGLCPWNEFININFN